MPIEVLENIKGWVFKIFIMASVAKQSMRVPLSPCGRGAGERGSGLWGEQDSPAHPPGASRHPLPRGERVSGERPQRAGEGNGAKGKASILLALASRRLPASPSPAPAWANPKRVGCRNKGGFETRPLSLQMTNFQCFPKNRARIAPP
jgi:hypothetical protein